jgi:hypothetical protein
MSLLPRTTLHSDSEHTPCINNTVTKIQLHSLSCLWKGHYKFITQTLQKILVIHTSPTE